MLVQCGVMKRYHTCLLSTFSGFDSLLRYKRKVKMKKNTVNVFSLGIVGAFLVSALLIASMINGLLDISIIMCFVPIFAFLGFTVILAIVVLVFIYKLLKERLDLKDDSETLKNIYSQIGVKRNG